MEEENIKKRPHNEISADKEEKSENETKSVPAYGSQEYWNSRYKGQISSSEKDDSERPEASHAWYFNYEELSPILLPLILGDDETADDNEEEDVDKNETNGIIENDGKETESISNSGNLENGSGGSNEDKGQDREEKSDSEEDEEEVENDELIEFEEVDEDEEDEEACSTRIGLAKNGPISVLEVGCGDVPLGRDLAKGIEQLSKVTGVEGSRILKQIVCIDYAKNVIEAMKKEQEEEVSKAPEPTSSVILKYEVGDARKLSYADSSFELILEKGTMDAMLSDSDVGSENCRLIVAECARLLTSGGCLLIVSHLNAHVGSGLQWLNKIVVPGLRKGCGENKWEIEVHGNAPDYNQPTENTEEEEEVSPGPAVYIIHKGENVPTSSSTSESDSKFPGVRLRFFSY